MDFFKKIYYPICHILGLLGPLIVISYYFIYPNELYKFSIYQILKLFGIIIVTSTPFAVISTIIIKLSGKDLRTEAVYLNKSLVEWIPKNLLTICLVIGEDSIFIINFLPQFQNILALQIFTSIIFGMIHYPEYRFIHCISKAVISFFMLYFSNDFINWNITHILLDYLSIKFLLWFHYKEQQREEINDIRNFLGLNHFQNILYSKKKSSKHLM
ncbi:MAG: hypothetical protein Satyrvirus11_19 [Satyrvirus sp.]|uniref:Uncharacterized protein n=1 Tax=Satyrvirus sp. TaxID=2487771 RepID=A0A3G5ADT8_9VIRU|nr:MAG: hypothetical protein Satyrvirus11_19 [Satyrvirus sp.]